MLLNPGTYLMPSSIVSLLTTGGPTPPAHPSVSRSVLVRRCEAPAVERDVVVEPGPPCRSPCVVAYSPSESVACSTIFATCPSEAATFVPSWTFFVSSWPSLSSPTPSPALAEVALRQPGRPPALF
jgi:hypothetical protein